MPQSGIFNKSYSDWYAIARSVFEKFWLTIGISFLLLIPYALGSYAATLMTLVYIAIVGAIGLNILTGYTGQVSLAHAAFMAVGGYTSAMLYYYLGVQFLPAMLIGGFVTAFFSLIFGIASFKIKGFYLAIATLFAHYIVIFILTLPQVAYYAKPHHGLFLGTLSIGPFKIPPELHKFAFYYIALGFAVLSIIVTKNLMSSYIGRAFIAIRDNDLVANILGVNIARYKLLAFFISSFFTGLAGALLVFYFRSIVIGMFDFSITIEYIAMILVGGLGRIWGSILGAFLITTLSEALRFLITAQFAPIFPELVGLFDAIKVLLFGLIIISVILLEPNGLVFILKRIKEYFRLWPFRYW